MIMKTTQEEAEEMATCGGVFFRDGGPKSISASIMREIPLPELIAVARAANGLSFGTDWNNGTHAKGHGYRQRLIDALHALRATGKVELRPSWTLQTTIKV